MPCSEIWNVSIIPNIMFASGKVPAEFGMSDLMIPVRGEPQWKILGWQVLSASVVVQKNKEKRPERSLLAAVLPYCAGWFGLTPCARHAVPTFKMIRLQRC